MNTDPPFSVTILGNASAVPTLHSNLTAQVVGYGRKKFMIDCGEGTQHQMLRWRIKQSNIDHLFISHLHGDHFYGLFGLISTFHLFGRDKLLTIHAPSELEQLLQHVLKVSTTQLRFPVQFQALEDFSNMPLYQDDQLVIQCFPVLHRIPTWGFKFNEKPKERKLNKEFIQAHRPTIQEIRSIKAGNGFMTASGIQLNHQQITIAPLKSRSYAFCADTAYHEPIISHIYKSDLIYHEATFDNSMKQLAEEKFHSTAQQAATIALKADVGQLLLGHFSARHKDLSTLLREAKEVFPATILSEEGISYPIGGS
jgi:ribonuclease Z